MQDIAIMVLREEAQSEILEQLSVFKICMAKKSPFAEEKKEIKCFTIIERLGKFKALKSYYSA